MQAAISPSVENSTANSAIDEMEQRAVVVSRAMTCPGSRITRPKLVWFEGSGGPGTGSATALIDMNQTKAHEKPSEARGRLKIGDDWNAITIIALSQSSPLKAIAELVENSIDAKARTVTITRGREHGRPFLAIRDDGEGVPRDSEGRPDFRYVATHICDSVKRRLKADGTAGLQGEFGIGFLSFWTVGDELTMTSTGADQRAYQMVMRKGDPSYSVSPKRDAVRRQRNGNQDRAAARRNSCAVGREDPVVPGGGTARSYPPDRSEDQCRRQDGAQAIRSRAATI